MTAYSVYPLQRNKTQNGKNQTFTQRCEQRQKRNEKHTPTHIWNSKANPTSSFRLRNVKQCITPNVTHWYLLPLKILLKKCSIKSNLFIFGISNEVIFVLMMWGTAYFNILFTAVCASSLEKTLFCVSSISCRYALFQRWHFKGK